MRQEPGKPSLAESRKRDFVNRARAIAKRALALPAMPVLPIIAFAAAVIAALAGAFGTDEMPSFQRYGFWLVLMTIESAKWLAWLAWQVNSREDYWRAALLGTLVLNLLLPLEIWASFRLVGWPGELVFAPVVMIAVPLGLTILVVMTVVHPPRWVARLIEGEPGLLAKEGVRPEDVLAASSEDHYCRLYIAGGDERLIAARLADVIEELLPVAGTRIHRSHWVSDVGVKTARRAGRGWEVVLPGGTGLRVSATYREEAKRRGWLSRGR